MKIITAIDEDEEQDDRPLWHQTLFLAGGITNCPDWQDTVIRRLQEKKMGDDLVIYNPRRPSFLMDNLNAAREQIKWEFRYLKLAKHILFWFPCETLCPITLFEYGRWLGNKSLFIGCHPKYKRIEDVRVQTSLVNSYTKIHTNINDIVDEFVEYYYLNLRLI